MAQERIDDWWEYAKDLAKVERELQIERWVYISIEYKNEAGRNISFIHFIRILTIYFHSSPDNFERVGFKESQSFNDSELIILRNFVNE